MTYAEELSAMMDQVQAEALAAAPLYAAARTDAAKLAALRTYLDERTANLVFTLDEYDRGDVIDERARQVLTQAQAEEALGVKFQRDARARRFKHTVVVLKVARADQELAKDASRYVGPGGSGAAKPGAYAEFARFLAEARAAGKPIDMPRFDLHPDGLLTLDDGRHRFGVFRDEGALFLPVSVPHAHADEFRARFGYRPFAKEL